MTDRNEYMKVYMLDRYHKRKAKAIMQLGGVCVDCGTDKNLHFDHIDPNTKSFTLGQRLSSVSEKKLQEELDKCQLLCQTCHELKSINELGNKVAKGAHGTVSSYLYCKCSECREAKAMSNKAQRAKKLNILL